MSRRMGRTRVAMACVVLLPVPTAASPSAAAPLPPPGPQKQALVLNDVDGRTALEKSPDELIKEFPQLFGLQPDTDQKNLPAILEKVGGSVDAYFKNFVSTSAEEEVIQQRLTPNGKVDESFKQKFRFLLVSSGRENGFDLEEYRTTKKGKPADQKRMPSGTVTKGFASMPALLHPILQPQSRFKFLGRQQKQGRDLLVIAFAQDPSRANFREKINGDLGEHVVYLEGVVWIDSAGYQVVQMDTDILPGTSPANINHQLTDITFAEVHFEGIPAVFWLPQQVEVTTDRIDGVLRNYHKYSGYRLFTSQTKMIVPPG